MASKALTTLILIVAAIFAFPFLIGALGAAIGLVAGIFGAIVGLIGGIIGAMFGTVNWIFHSPFDWHWGAWHLNLNVYTFAALVIIAILVFRSRKN